MREAPPTRYKVVERGRRLEVIDTWNNNAPVRPAPPRQAPATERREPRRTTPPSAGRSGPSGERSLSTSAWYDAKGPRRISLGTRGEEKLTTAGILLVIAGVALLLFAWLLWPLSLALPLLLTQDKVRTALRRGGAAFIDTLERD